MALSVWHVLQANFKRKTSTLAIALTVQLVSGQMHPEKVLVTVSAKLARTLMNKDLCLKANAKTAQEGDGLAL